MSEENVEIVRRIWEAWERRDSQAALALHDPQVEATGSIWPDGGLSQWRGHEGIRQWMRDWIEQFDDFYAHAEEFTDARERVIVRVRHGGRGKASGAVVELTHWRVYTLRDGRVVRIEDHGREEDALRAAGLLG